MGTFLTLLAKQNFGIVLLLVVFLYIIFNKKSQKIKLIFTYVVGLSSGSFVFVNYLLLTNSLWPFLQDMYTETFQRLIIGNDIGTPFLYYTGSINSLLKTCFYLFPEFLFSICFLLSLKRKDHYWHFFLFLVLFYISGIRPTTDYVHIVPILSLLGIPLTYLVISTKPLYKFSILLITVFLIVTGLYTALFKGYYRWNLPLISQNHFTTNGNADLFLDSKDIKMIKAMEVFTKKYSLKNKYIYVNEYFPMIYFVTNRQNPTPDDVISSSKFYDSRRPKVITLLKKKNVNVIFTTKDWKTANLGYYIGKHYLLLEDVGNFFAWTRL